MCVCLIFLHLIMFVAYEHNVIMLESTQESRLILGFMLVAMIYFI